MNKGRRYENYDYLKEDVIRKACMGDNGALSAVIVRYENYGRKCFRSIATVVFGLDADTVPVDDLMQLVWCKVSKVIEKKFKITR